MMCLITLFPFGGTRNDTENALISIAYDRSRAVKNLIMFFFTIETFAGIIIRLLSLEASYYFGPKNSESSIFSLRILLLFIIICISISMNRWSLNSELSKNEQFLSGYAN